jgi:hypothetical protein
MVDDNNLATPRTLPTSKRPTPTTVDDNDLPTPPSKIAKTTHAPGKKATVKATDEDVEIGSEVKTDVSDDEDCHDEDSEVAEYERTNAMADEDRMVSKWVYFFLYYLY